jgi:hypothetical protein
LTLLLANRHILTLDDRKNHTILIGRLDTVDAPYYLNTIAVQHMNLPNNRYFSRSIVKGSPLDV